MKNNPLLEQLLNFNKKFKKEIDMLCKILYT